MKPGDKLRHIATGIDVHYVTLRSDGLISVKLPSGMVVNGKAENYRRITRSGKQVARPLAMRREGAA